MVVAGQVFELGVNRNFDKGEGDWEYSVEEDFEIVEADKEEDFGEEAGD